MPEDPTIACPKCKAPIKVTETLAAPLLAATKAEYEEKIKQNQKQSEEWKKGLLDRFEKSKAQIEAESTNRIRRQFELDLEQQRKDKAELEALLQSRDKKLSEAQAREAECIRRERAVEDQKRELEITVEKRINEGLLAAREQARQEAESSLKLKVAEKDHTIQAMQKQIEDLKRRAEQGSQQLQGEVQELELEGMLAIKFPFDTIEPVRKGELGADVIQRVVSPGGKPCGTILWESKRTKNWSQGWLAKLREDQRAAKAEIAILVSQALPEQVKSFELMEGIWVAHPQMAQSVAFTLRLMLIEVEKARKTSEGQKTKAELVYQYLTGSEFAHRIRAMVEAFSTLKEDLDREKVQMNKQWAKRDKLIEQMTLATAGMYGDLQAIAGKTMQEVKGLELDGAEDPAPLTSSDQLALAAC